MAAVAGLAVLEFSGTLSPGAARFATPGRLRDELRRSGLAELGVATPEVFWDVLVNPTWERGSTASAGYVTVLTDAAVAHLPDPDRHAVRAAVARFTARYLAASRLAPGWVPWLHRLTDLPVTTVVATDHYAEATGHIVDDFGAAEAGADAYADRITARRERTVALLGDVLGADVSTVAFTLTDDPGAAIDRPRRPRAPHGPRGRRPMSLRTPPRRHGDRQIRSDTGRDPCHRP